MEYKTVYPETREDTGLRFEAENDEDAISYFNYMYPGYQQIKAIAFGDIAAFIRQMTGVIVVLVEA